MFDSIRVAESEWPTFSARPVLPREHDSRNSSGAILYPNVRIYSEDNFSLDFDIQVCSDEMRFVSFDKPNTCNFPLSKNTKYTTAILYETH
jgi:hypothetical protein